MMDSCSEAYIVKKTKRQAEKFDRTANCFDRLPHEIVVDILSRLPITSLIRFSFVSKSLNSLSHDPNLVDAHLSHEGSSCLIFHSDHPIRNELHFLQLSDEKVRKFNIPFANSMPELSIIGSSNGLLCLINTLFPESIFLYNPFTRDYLELPKNYGSYEDQIVVYGFGFNPGTSDYKVIKISYYTNAFYYRMARNFRGFKVNHNQQESQVNLYSSSSKTWENKGLVPFRLEKWSSPGVLVSGRLHWVSRWGKYDGRHDRIIQSYDLSHDLFHVIANPASARSFTGRFMEFHIASLDGCLCVAIVVPPARGAFDIWVMKEYGVIESWTKDYSVGLYYPASRQMEGSNRMYSRNIFGSKLVKILCLMKSGEVLLEYKGIGLVSYDPISGIFKELVFHGMPRLYQTTVHVGSPKSIYSPCK